LNIHGITPIPNTPLAQWRTFCHSKNYGTGFLLLLAIETFFLTSLISEDNPEIFTINLGPIGKQLVHPQNDIKV